MKILSPLSVPLDRTTLIEASAGTGKTYTIATLYARLVAEGNPVNAILVVTFTEAAAMELKIRIRKRLAEMQGMLFADPHQDPLLDHILAAVHQKELSLRISAAIRDFDQCAIFTIHGFCLKILQDNAFECSYPFDFTLTPDISLLMGQFSHDFFTRNINHLDPLFLTFLAAKKATPQSFAGAFGNFLKRKIQVVPQADELDLSVISKYREITAEIRCILFDASDRIIDLFAAHQGIDKRSYSKRNVPAWIRAVKEKLKKEGANPYFDLGSKDDKLGRFSHDLLCEKTKPGAAAPEHPLFHLVLELKTLEAQFEQNYLLIKRRFIDEVDRSFQKMKQDQGICTFDDLINDVADALDDDFQGEIKKVVRREFSACLIDEFQDTDPVQYAIFEHLFSTPGTPFFMIGDPKQAIYAFRGGDIFAYLRAAAKVDSRYTLDVNYRSAPALIRAVNTVFSAAPDPFVYADIGFYPVKSPDSACEKILSPERFPVPFQFCFLKRDGQPIGKDGFIPTGAARQIIPDLLADQLLKDLRDTKVQKTPGIDPVPVSTGDMAVLVRTNQQAYQILDALKTRGIPAYLNKSGSVWESRQAQMLFIVLWAVDHPDHAGALKAAMTTDIFRSDREQIERLDTEPGAMARWHMVFSNFKSVWETHGFVHMINALLYLDEAFLNPASRLDERDLTNYHHLVELLSHAALKQKLSPYRLIRWFARQMDDQQREPDGADELRLESDREAVAVVTIHKSKGLEYPIVYLPYLWESPNIRDQQNVYYNDPDKGYAAVLDLGSPRHDHAAACREKQNFAELRRLLYVALTRASGACRIFWGGFKGVDTSALGAMLHPGGCGDDPKMEKDLKQLVAASDPGIGLDFCHESSPESIRYVPAAPAPETLSAKQSLAEIFPAWKITSFSGLIRDLPEDDDPAPGPKAPDVDENQAPIPDLLAAFPKGTTTGEAFHLVFETLDFTIPAPQIKQTAEPVFRQFGFRDEKQIASGAAAVRTVLDTPLDTGADRFCLKEIQNSDRITEMEFSFPVGKFTRSGMIQVFKHASPHTASSGYPDLLKRLDFQQFEGFFKGFIDLIIRYKNKFYILDYKTNYLGGRFEDYHPDVLKQAMSHHHYFLQYHLYLMALHRYLAFRLPEYDYTNHFGGVFYLFIRGMTGSREEKNGIFFDRPPKAFVSAWDDIFRS